MSPTRNPVPTKVVGSQHDRRYLDAFGRPLQVGDLVSYATASSSSVYLHHGKVKDFIDLDTPVYIGSEKNMHGDYVRCESWDLAYSLKVVPYEYDRVRDRWHVPERYDSALGRYVESTEDDVKLRNIRAVSRVIRLDLDV